MSVNRRYGNKKFDRFSRGTNKKRCWFGKKMWDEADRCDAVCLITGKQCYKYTKYKYCTTHYNILKQFCNKYHLLNLKHTKQYKHTSLHTLALVEYIMRLKFKKMFNMKDDVGHTKWMEYLKSLINEKDYGFVNKIKENVNVFISFPRSINFNQKLFNLNLEYLNLEFNILNDSYNNLDSNYRCNTIKKISKHDLFNYYF